MGMSSYFEYEDLEVKDWEGLVEFFEFWDKYIKEQNKGWEDIMSSKKMLDKKEKTISFESWDNIKLISYWYQTQTIFLELVSEFIEGEIMWNFESDDETGRVDFENGECNITTGTMDYTEWKPKDNYDRDGKLPTEIKKRIILKNIKK